MDGFKGRHADGEWSWARGERDRFASHLKGLKDGPWEVPAAEQPTRSDKANRYYFSAVLEPMAEHNGDSVKEMHAHMCEMFIQSDMKKGKFINEMTGEIVVVVSDVRRSSKLTGAPFFDFVEEVREFARNFLGVETEDPDPDYWRKR